MARPRPDLVALDLLVQVDELGSVGAAALRLGMAQPNASRALSRLERQLGVALLRRSPRGSVPTVEGGLVASWAREALSAVDRVTEGAASLVDQQRAHLTVAASLTIAEHLAPAWLARFRSQHPELRVSLDVRNSGEVLALVSAGSVPLGFVESPQVPSGVGSTVLARDELVVVVSPHHPWARLRRPVSAEEVARASMLLRERGSGTREAFELALAQAGLPSTEPDMELASSAALKTAAVAGGAAAVLSELAVTSELGAGTLVRVAVDDTLSLSRPLRAVWPRDARPSGPAADLVTVARRHRRQRAGTPTPLD